MRANFRPDGHGQIIDKMPLFENERPLASIGVHWHRLACIRVHSLLVCWIFGSEFLEVSGRGAAVE
jgi:hypothetical protein